MNLHSLRTLGRSGLLVSPLCLGTMTFSNDSWGSSDDVSRSIFNTYIDEGGSFIDTAEAYAGGRSEELIGAYIAERKLRDGVVLATKYSWNGVSGNPLAAGNGRKNLTRALEGSLRRLGTDFIDLYWVHIWDRVTPVEEVLQSLGDMVRDGKIRYFGFSNMPAWYTTRAATLAQVHGVPGPIALQMEYSLAERNIEHEFVPLAREMGLGIVPWSPLAFGFLTGKYKREDEKGAESDRGRLDKGGDTFKKFTDRNWNILDTLREVSEDAGLPLAQVALAWAVQRPGISSLIIGASKEEQLRVNIASLQVALSTEQIAKLDEASAPPVTSPYSLFSDEISRRIFAGLDVQGWN